MVATDRLHLPKKIYEQIIAIINGGRILMCIRSRQSSVYTECRLQIKLINLQFNCQFNFYFPLFTASSSGQKNTAKALNRESQGVEHASPLAHYIIMWDLITGKALSRSQQRNVKDLPGTNQKFEVAASVESGSTSMKLLESTFHVSLFHKWQHIFRRKQQNVN